LDVLRFFDRPPTQSATKISTMTVAIAAPAPAHIPPKWPAIKAAMVADQINNDMSPFLSTFDPLGFKEKHLLIVVGRCRQRGDSF
jgi:hypothetical protein